MGNTNSYESKLSQARGLASQLGMFAEENDIPKDLWDSLEAIIYEFYEVSSDRWDKVYSCLWIKKQDLLIKMINKCP